MYPHLCLFFHSSFSWVQVINFGHHSHSTFHTNILNIMMYGFCWTHFLEFRILLQFEDCTLEWLYWPQARQPFSLDTTAYINSLDAEKDIELLKFYGWDVSAQCARIFRISTMLLKKGAERGLTPFAIGSIMCRETLKKESVIEKMIKEAHESVLPGTSESTFLECISVIMDQYLDRVWDETWVYCIERYMSA